LLGLEVRVAPADLDEDAWLLADAEPAVSAVNLALAKLRATPADPGEVIVAADTLVVVDDDILGKPATPHAATHMLERLRGRAHQVLTGVALQTNGVPWAGVVSTRVEMRAYTSAEVAAYVARGEPFDKAGGYAVQDQTFRPVEALVGCYLNVVGLPVCAVAAGLNALGWAARPAEPPPCAYCRAGAPLVSSSVS
jgi:MAF protein